MQRCTPVLVLMIRARGLMMLEQLADNIGLSSAADQVQGMLPVFSQEVCVCTSFNQDGHFNP